LQLNNIVINAILFNCNSGSDGDPMDFGTLRHGLALANWLNGTAEQLRTGSIEAVCKEVARTTRSDERARIRRKAMAYERRRALPALLTLSRRAEAEVAAVCESYDTKPVIRTLCRRINQQIKLRREGSTFFDHRYLADLRAALGGEIARRQRKSG
jgi:hypothetical protein